MWTESSSVYQVSRVSLPKTITWLLKKKVLVVWNADSERRSSASFLFEVNYLEHESNERDRTLIKLVEQD